MMKNTMATVRAEVWQLSSSILKLSRAGKQRQQQRSEGADGAGLARRGPAEQDRALDHADQEHRREEGPPQQRQHLALGHGQQIGRQRRSQPRPDRCNDEDEEQVERRRASARERGPPRTGGRPTRPSRSAMMISMILGGMRIPSVPAAAMVPQASAWL